MEPRSTPVTLTRYELAIFNKFWESLDDNGRQILSEILDAASSLIPSVDEFGYPVSYLAFLLAMLVEEHKKVLRLNQQNYMLRALLAEKDQKSQTR